ncbi:hypothetical protein E0198_002288 [Clavispora lusitaniae]|nr:hypothetical protein E0198_002288 [Clavispora lusitaniae]
MQTLVKPGPVYSDLNSQYESYLRYFSVKGEILTSHDMFKRFDENYTSESDITDETLRSEFQLAQRYLKSLNIIPVFHFHKSTSYVHSKPFVFAVFPDELFEDTKTRLRKKLGLGIQAFEKIKIALADSTIRRGSLTSMDNDLNLLQEILCLTACVVYFCNHPDHRNSTS